MGKLKEAYFDLKFLLNRGYRKKLALEFVCNHYMLPLQYRHFLARCVFSDYWINEVREKISSCEEKILGIDGFNILITVESLMEGTAIRCEDGIVRDLKYQGKYKINEKTEKAIEVMLLAIKELNPIILYGRSNPKSAEIKIATQKKLKEIKIKGKVRLVKSPDFELKKFEYVSTGDVGIIRSVPYLVNIFSHISRILNKNPIDFKEMLDILDERLK